MPGEELTQLSQIQTKLDQAREISSGTFNRTTDSLEAIANAIAALSLGGGTASSANQELIKDGNAGDFVATEDSLHDLRSSIGRTIITGAANRRLEDTPYYLASPIVFLDHPRVDQASIVTAYQSFSNVNGALPTTSEITPGTYDIDRFRPGTDADWTNIVNDSALTEANGIVRFSYTFPAASWQLGDMIRVVFTGTSVVFGGKTITIPDSVAYSQVQGVPATDSTANIVSAHVVGSKADAASTTVNTTTSLVAYTKGLLNQVNHATYGLSALQALIAAARETADGGFDRETDSLEAIRDFLTTMNSTINTINSSIGGGAGTDLDALIALHAVPSADSANNVNMRDVIGNKGDATITDSTAFTNTSLARKVLTLQRAMKSVIADTDVNLTSIDNALTTAPDGSNTPDAANTVLNLPFVSGTRYRLDNFTFRVSSLGTGTTVTVQLWIPINGTMTNVKSVVIGSALSDTIDYTTSDYLNLLDAFGYTFVDADAIAITAVSDAGNTSVLVGTLSYSVARSS